ncbi:acetyl-CoA hydrolase/transferase C-terminal domain-containing protein [Phycicoccus sp. SLBN-51]|uniref:acetyl-CoA hydrolase/transferase family protein n=1 Tax=Phycicoccus sp. SLBN-51 TaxID=2768447 RepID=UPI00114DF2CF|nr:acetyl-CoA hydrolase/transferase C-terminal domain-containing protein [Phycicoccus sp. SLBN-51]TQJ49167.1 acyl-CoA hydrolase [Phycicoccus sp. SLBN-51]
MRVVELEEAVRLAEAVQAVGSEPRVVTSGNFATPLPLLEAIAAELPAFRLHLLNPQRGLPLHDGVVPETMFVGPGFRGHPRLAYVPSRLSLAPRLFASTLPPDIVLIHTTLPRDGMVSLGTEVNVLPAAIEAVRARGGLVLAQLNSLMPWTFGDAIVPVEHIDAGVEVEQKLAVHVPSPPDHTSAHIGAQVAAAIGDGATIQAGIGAVPDATVAGLIDRRGLRVWTEMFSDGILALEQAGALDADAPINTSFVFGSEELYAWLDGNERVVLRRTEVTNSPARIAEQRMMTSVNTALQIDLFGQANASRIRARIYSGFGGQTDFTVGALQSPGGQAFMALRSWHPKADCSTIVPLVDEPVTSFQHSAVVTEQGVARIAGLDERTQARNLIEHAAHPDVRDELREEARALGLM